MNTKYLKHVSVLAFSFALLFGFQSAYGQEEEVITLDTVQVVGTAEDQVKQSLGASIITSEDIAKNPPASDLSEIIRRQPGVNLTGNSASGSRGNNRQIDLRGMGPENTLILIDGRPVKSRNSVRYGWSEERDTRGDSNWVPAEMVDRIEVLRGPSAARYGSGAMGGVVNIITKKPTDKVSGSLGFMGTIQEDSDEGNAYRFNGSIAGPLGKDVSFRIYGSKSYRDADAVGINRHVDPAYSNAVQVAGREGFRNQDLNALVAWDINKSNNLEVTGGYSRQGNIYAGDTMQNLNNDYASSLYGDETNIMRRKNIAATHTGDWSWGNTRVDVSFDRTTNTRFNEGLVGATEGAISDPDASSSANIASDEMSVSTFDAFQTSFVTNIPLNLFGFVQTLTIGAEYSEESLDDKGTIRIEAGQANGDWLGGAIGQIPGYDPSKTKTEQYNFAFYVEDNIYVGHGVTVTPGVRFDYNELFGSNVSPSLNAYYEFATNWTIKGGIASAYKAPNLYQTNPNYLLYSRGQGCVGTASTTGCYLQGNEDLDPEKSLNKEIGIAYKTEPFSTSVTYFHNDYENKVQPGKVSYGDFVLGGRANDIYRWENAGDAVIEGLEGNIFVAISSNIDFNTNVTYMIKSETKEDKQPLSIIPEYTVNTFIDWRATDKLSLGANATFYGEQETPTKEIRTGATIAKDTLGSYALFGLSAQYKLFDNLRLKAGVNNLFDKQIYRKGNATSVSDANTGNGKANAATYNEPGRSYYVAATMDF